MQYTNLGRTGMKVSRFCLGTTNFGAYTDEKEAFRIMDVALEHGINYFDTANEYGGGHKGITETMIGKWFAQGGRRKKVILQTKSFSWMADADDPANETAHGLSIYKLRRNLEDSLRRLQTDHLEVYMMHHFDRGVTLEEILDCYQAMFQQGKIDYIASSNSSGFDLMATQAAAAQKHYLGLVCEEHQYNLLCRLPELELLPTAQKLGLGVVAYSPLHAGMLAGPRTSSGASRRVAKAEGMFSPNNRPTYMSALDIPARLAQYSAFCNEIGYSEPVVALAWLLSNPVLTAPIVGPRNVEQLESLLPALELTLTEDMLRKLDEIFPGPGGAAPEAYAW